MEMSAAIASSGTGGSASREVTAPDAFDPEPQAHLVHDVGAPVGAGEQVAPAGHHLLRLPCTAAALRTRADRR